VAPDVLEVQRQVGDGAEQSEAHDEADGARDAEDAVLKELERQDRFRRPAFREDEGGKQDDPPTISAIIHGEVRTLTSKIQRQERLSTKKPPRSGPATVETPKTPPKYP